ncbi:CTP synthase [Candidatus Micrarchaeota archaeon]|nr:CTP synthase [Candidatus Micrarchaeota archaeon]
MSKFVFVTGGVLSSLGKGSFAASLAKLLKEGGVKVSVMKIDPYLNCDAGTLNPFEHGEVFVTRDGFECDLDVGNYERFLNEFAVHEQNLMMGSVYKAVIDKERRGDYLGKTIQLIPHATNEVKARIRSCAKVTGADVLIVEIGGTVGDLESEVVLEAARQMNFEEPPEAVTFVHLALVPTITTGEAKTKPMQHSVKALLARGITPNFLVARADSMLTNPVKEKIALFCNVREENVFTSPTLDSVYELPLTLEKQGVAQRICERMHVKFEDGKLDEWKKLVGRLKELREKGPTVKIGVVGKYATGAKDAYMSVFESLLHAGVHNDVHVDASLIDSEALEKGKANLSEFQGILVPGGFGGRGVEGKIAAVKFARENGVPYLGICYGLQLAVIESGRNLLGFKDANTTENEPDTKHPVIDILPEQKTVTEKGGTMRLGAKQVLVLKGTKAFELYKSEKITKRFRHRYEINPEFVKQFEEAGWVFSGKDPEREIMKIGELKDHPFFMGTQAHPEFDSRLEEPEPLYYGFVKAAKGRAE